MVGQSPGHPSVAPEDDTRELRLTRLYSLDYYTEAWCSGETHIGCQQWQIMRSGGSDVECVICADIAMVVPGKPSQLPIRYAVDWPVRHVFDNHHGS